MSTSLSSKAACAVLAVASLSLFAACGGSTPTTTAPATTSPSASGQQGGSGGGGTGRQGQFPGTSGTIAAISGTTLQVQGTSDQVAVTYTPKTAITQEVSGTLASVKVGSCVVATPDRTAASSGSTGNGGGSTVAAARVTITAPAADGTCDRGFGGGGFGGGFGGGNRPSGAPTVRPSGAPTGGPRGGRSFGFGAFGTVSAVSASGFTVTSTQPGSTDTKAVQVTVSSATTYSSTASATAKALKTGECVTATGQADDTGAITAQRLAISQPVNGQCGGFGFGRGQGAAGQGGNQGGDQGGAAS